MYALRLLLDGFGRELRVLRRLRPRRERLNVKLLGTGEANANSMRERTTILLLIIIIIIYNHYLFIIIILYCYTNTSLLLLPHYALYDIIHCTNSILHHTITMLLLMSSYRTTIVSRMTSTYTEYSLIASASAWRAGPCSRSS